jgi:hypothetical protein
MSHKHIVNIAYHGNTHGNFLRYFIDRYSRLTPEIKELPFLSNGTSHNTNIKYSNLVNRYHPIDHNNEFINKNEPQILITIKEEDIHYLHRLTFIRDVDPARLKTSLQIIIDNDEKILLSDSFKKKLIKNLKKLYNLDDIDVDNKIHLPKYIIRDFLKLHYLNTNEDGFLKSDTQLKKKAPDNTFFFPVDAFWDIKKFFKTIEECNFKLNLKLNLDYSATDVYEEFVKRLYKFETKDRSKIICDKILKGEEFDIVDIDIVEEGYISSWIEKNYNFINVPLTNYFFKNTKEIIEWIKWYPQHYKAMNPNLPMFNGIPNPFYLWNLKK